MDLTRRHFLKLLGQGVLAAGLSAKFPQLAEAANTGTLPIRYVRQIITWDSRTSRTIMWQSASSLPDCQIEYRPQTNRGLTRQTATMTSLTEDGTTNYYYHATLTRLQPDTIYAYRIVHGNRATSWYTLRTAPTAPAPFTALIFCDSQCAKSYDDWQTVLQAAIERHPDSQWFADIGDLTDNGQSDWHWSSFFAAMGALPTKIPFVPIMGNHECYGLDWKFCSPVRYLTSFVLPSNGGQLPGYYYSYDYGFIHFIVLNTQLLELAEFQPGLRSEQQRWLKQDAASHHQPWQVVLMHKDILAYDEYQAGTKTTGGISDVGHAFMPLFDTLKIDLVLTGHMHTYRNRGHIQGAKPSATGPVYILSGPAGNEQYRVPADTTYDHTAIQQPTPENYLLLKSEKNQLTITDYTVNGELIDTVVLTK